MEPPPLPPRPILQIERAVAPISIPDPALEHTLQAVLFPPGSPLGACQRQGGARYVFNLVDVDGDREPEILVALLGQRRCGKEGCPLLLLRSVGESLLPLQTLAGLHTALVVSERRSHGWRDLILPPAEGAGASAPRWLIHNGARYPTLSEPGGTEVLREPARGVTALAIKQSPYLVQGHPLPCPPRQRDQRKAVLGRDHKARPSASQPLVPAVVEAFPPAVWVATRVISSQQVRSGTLQTVPVVSRNSRGPGLLAR
jgi:hypothetical protein